ncbi:aminotransferase class I/II-fold pyridoxal phosphate-dependent enzyme, partial [Achromobacter mucicolens]|uniref:aminotransferase class I/II-fold pyridoxal phosphate-dependent enzyme n=1 Tax=Achromobacter mucicolens TaxID=1389922 RepID=UPI0028999250
MPRLASRTHDFLTFQVMELFKQAQALQAAGKDIISLGIGEPDFTAPPQVVEALDRAARAGLSGYSPGAGIAPLRDAIAQFYRDQFGAAIDPRRVIVTAGA